MSCNKNSRNTKRKLCTRYLRNRTNYNFTVYKNFRNSLTTLIRYSNIRSIYMNYFYNRNGNMEKNVELNQLFHHYGKASPDRTEDILHIMIALFLLTKTLPVRSMSFSTDIGPATPHIIPNINSNNYRDYLGIPGYC